MTFDPLTEKPHAQPTRNQPDILKMKSVITLRGLEVSAFGLPRELPYHFRLPPSILGPSVLGPWALLTHPGSPSLQGFLSAPPSAGMMIHQTCFLLSLSLGLYEDGSFLHRLETQLPPKPPAPFLCLKFPIGLPSSNTLRIRLSFRIFFLSSPQEKINIP